MDKTLLIEAVAEFDRTAPERQAMLDSAETEADVAAWDAALAKALEPVQEAFYQLTKEYNSREKCCLVNIDDARAFAEGRPQGRSWDVPIEKRL